MVYLIYIYIYSEDGFKELFIEGELPDDTSTIFFILKKILQEGFILEDMTKEKLPINQFFQL